MALRIRFNYLICSAILAAFPAFSAQDRITSRVDATKTASLRGHLRPEATALNDRGLVDPAMPIRYATLYLTPAPGLEAFLAEQQTPSSASYHRWLTPQQFADRFGLTGNDTGRIVAWLQSEGLTVHDIALGRHWITFSGTAAQVGRAFHTELHHYQVNGVDHFANATEISVPAAFASVVSAVDGLDDFVLEPLYRKAASTPRETTGNTHYLAPDDIATIYNIAPLYAAGNDGTGQKIVVVGRTDINLQDIRNFRARYNLPARDPQVVLYGPDPGVSAGDVPESDLDLEWAGAVARNATIIFVNSRSVNTSAQYAIDQNLAPVMTMSYGSCETLVTDTLRSVAQQAAAQGITWMISSGDSGAATCDRDAPIPQASKGDTVSYPASIPEVTAVGGTQFNDATGTWWGTANSSTRSSALSYIPEKVWNQSFDNNRLEAGGGGISALYAKPAWQLGPGVPNDGQRDLPDISFSAATHDAYDVITGGNLAHYGGTSVSSPVFAGIVALLNQSIGGNVGNINPALYRLAQATTDVFHDTTVGDNTVPCKQGSPQCVGGVVGYAATPGYDLATGLGSLDVANFIHEWNTGTTSTTILHASPASYSVSDNVTLTATVSGAAVVPTGTVTFVAGDVTLGTVTLTASDSHSATAALTIGGTVFAAGNGTAGALYSGDGTFTASSGSASLVLNVPATGSFVLPSVVPNPVHQVGTTWPFTVTLTEKAGIATRLTAFTVNGGNDLALVPNPNISAGASLAFSLITSGITAPVNRTFHFEGVDADGTTWQRDLVVPFLGPEGTHLVPSMTLNLSPSTVQQNPNADPSCQWSQQVTVQELSGFEVSLSSFTAGTTSFTSQLSAMFGTTRLAPFGTLTGTVCFSGITAPQQKTYSIAGAPEVGGTLTATATASFTAPAASASTFSVSEPALTLTDTAALKLNFAGDSSSAPAWKVAVFGPSPKWLTVSTTSGTGSATLLLTPSAAGLSNGVYNAVVSIQATNAIPQSIQVPITFVVGGSPAASILGIGNAASGTQGFAPGQLVAVYGNNLAPSSLSATVQPLPFTLSGVSATVNGVSAPLWFISPGQINLQIPYEIGAGPAVLGVNNNGLVSFYNFNVAPTAPGTFTYQGSMVPYASAKAGQTIVGFITGDGDVTPTLASGATAPATTLLTQYPKSRQPLTMTIGGEPAQIVFNGIVTGEIGVTQVNFTVPPDLPAGVQPVVFTVGGVSSAPVNLTITP